MDADAEALTCPSAQRTLYWEWSRPRAAKSLPGSPANLQAARAINTLLMMGQNAHSVKVVGFGIKSSQPASTAPFCRCTLLSGPDLDDRHSQIHLCQKRNIEIFRSR
jgi:hypothetical protein